MGKWEKIDQNSELSHTLKSDSEPLKLAGGYTVLYPRHLKLLITIQLF